jgi:RimJ/RimL family protein N-acetyltransferase
VDASVLVGARVSLARLDPVRHGRDLWEAIGSRPHVWSNIPPGPFDTETAFIAWMEERSNSAGDVLYAIMNTSGPQPQATGLLLVLRVNPAMGTLEIGLLYGPALTRQTAGTEAFFLLADYLLGTLAYRRLEWRCNTTNLSSRQAAARFGFTAEGILRQTMFVRGRNCDTAVFSILDREWPALRSCYEAWLSPENFGPDGKQKRSFSAAR